LPIKSVGGGSSKTTIELSERLYNPSFPFLNGTFSDPSTTTQPYWNQAGNTTQFFTFSGGVAQVERYDVLNPVYVSLAHALHQVNSGRDYTFTFEARGIPDTPPTGSIYSVLGYGVDGQGGTLELTDDTWRTYTYNFTATSLYVTASFLRYPGSQGVEIRNVNITQDGGDYLCKPFLRHYDGTTVTNTLLDFTASYTVTDEDNVSICCCEQPLAHTEDRATGTTNVDAPFSSINVIAYSNDVTINGNAITSGTSWGISASKGEVFSNSVTIVGTDYFVTTIKKS